MTRLVTVLRGVAAVVLGLLGSGPILIVGRQIAFGNGTAPSPAGLGGGPQAIVAITWMVAAAMASWVAALVSRRTLPPLIVTAWLFQMAWLSTGVRPAEIGMRLACSAAVAIGGLLGMLAHRERLTSSTT